QQQRVRRASLDLQFPRALDEPFLSFRTVPLFARHPLSITPERICFSYTIQKIRLASPCQTPKRSFTDFIAFLVKLTRLEMFPHERNYLPAHVVTVQRVHFNPVEETLRRGHARLFMPAGAQPAIDKFSCSRLTEVMSERREHHRYLSRIRKIVDQPTRSIQHQFRVYKNISLGMPLRILRHSNQTLDLREEFF